MEGYFAMFLGKVVSICVMWAMIGGICWFASALPVTGLIGKPALGLWQSATQGAARVLLHWIGQSVAWLLRHAINLVVTIATYAAWLLWCLFRRATSGPGAPPHGYPPAPGWVNVFPPPRRRRGNGHGRGGGHH